MIGRASQSVESPGLYTGLFREGAKLGHRDVITADIESGQSHFMTLRTLTHHERTLGNLYESKERLVGKIEGIRPKARVPDRRKNVPRLDTLAAAEGS